MKRRRYTMDLRVSVNIRIIDINFHSVTSMNRSAKGLPSADGTIHALNSRKQLLHITRRNDSREERGTTTLWRFNTAAGQLERLNRVAWPGRK